MKYRALRFAGRLFFVGAGLAGHRPARQRFASDHCGGGRQRADVGCASSGRTVVRPYIGGRGGIVSAGWARHQPAERVALS